MSRTAEPLTGLESELLTALKLARRHVVELDFYLAKYEPGNRYTVGDLMKIETAIARPEGIVQR